LAFVTRNEKLICRENVEIIHRVFDICGFQSDGGPSIAANCGACGRGDFTAAFTIRYQSLFRSLPSKADRCLHPVATATRFPCNYASVFGAFDRPGMSTPVTAAEVVSTPVARLCARGKAAIHTFHRCSRGRFALGETEEARAE
jgi:hypothetical protein